MSQAALVTLPIVSVIEHFCEYPCPVTYEHSGVSFGGIGKGRSGMSF